MAELPPVTATLKVVAPAPPVAPKTGLGSTSFAIYLLGALPGLATLLSSFTAHGSSLQVATRAVVGGSLALGSTVVKLIHDKGIHEATIAAAQADVAQALPGLRSDLATVQDFVENELPSVRPVLAGLDTRFHDIEHDIEARFAALPGADEIAEAVRQTVANIFATAAPTVAPAAPGTAPVRTPESTPVP